MADLVIDLSHWNTVSSWSKVKGAGIMAVIHKATEGSSYIDDQYHGRKSPALAEGLLWGAYHFLRPGNMATQAQHFVDTSGQCDLYAADHEDPGVSLSDLKAFLSEVYELTGILPVVYSGHVIKEQVGSSSDPELAQYRLWLAQYSSSPSWPTKIWPKWWIWQHTDQGDCPGIEGDTDLNQYDGTAQQLVDDWVGAEPVPEPEPEPGPAVVTVTISVAGNATVKVITDEDEAS
jgi:lysozyme